MRTLLVCLAIVTLGLTCRAETLDYTAKDGFTITIPDNWDVIPKAEIQKMTQQLRQQAPNAQIPNFGYGFQAKGKNWFSYPYMLVWVKPTGKIPESELRQLSQAEVAAAAKKSLQDSGEIVQNFDVGKPVYDPRTRIIWATSNASYPNVGEVGILNGGVLTEQGEIWVYGYALKKDFPDLRRVFAKIIASVTVTEELRYRPTGQ